MAIPCYQLSAALEPRLAAAWKRLAVACHELGRYGDAARAYRLAADLEPGDTEAFAGLVYCKQVRGKGGRNHCHLNLNP